MSTIVYATDYSENSIAALRYASSVSLKTGAKLVAIHVFDYPTLLNHLGFEAEDPFPDIEGDAYRKHNAKLEAFCRKVLKDDLDRLTFDFEAIEHKSIVNGIVEKAKAVDASLIVTGMKGGSAVKELIMGNTAKHLLEKSPCPVLSIPSDASSEPIATIVYATDFEDEDYGAINKLLEIARPFKAKIKLVHIAPPEKLIGKRYEAEIQNAVCKYIDYEDMDLDIIYSDDTFNALRIYLAQTNADMVAMLKREPKSISSQVFHYDLVTRMESYGKVPLISFHAKNYGIFKL